MQEKKKNEPNATGLGADTIPQKLRKAEVHIVPATPEEMIDFNVYLESLTNPYVEALPGIQDVSFYVVYSEITE